MTVNRIAAGAAVCCAVMFASACGGGTAATGAPATSSTTAPSAGASGGGTGTTGRSFPGASGLLAQIDGTTLQVQGTDAQVAVTYSAATTFTNTVTAHRSDIVVGVCVQARSARTATGASAAPTSAPGATSEPVKAASVEISAAVNGTCTALGGLRASGGLPPGSSGDATRPAGAPNPGRTRGPGAGGGFAGGGFGAFGKVTAVSGSSFTLESSRPQNGTATTASPVARTVETSATTTFTQTKAASSKALVVGQCVTALGKADDTGSIAATTIALRPAENGSCSTGFGGRAPSDIPTSPGGGSGA